MNDLRKPECPNCKSELTKVPSRKTKCRSCGQFIFVRTRPIDRVRVLTTEDGAKKIDAEWTEMTSSHDRQYVSRTYPYTVVSDDEVRIEKERLKAQSGFDRSDNDVRWSIFNQKLLEFAGSNDWGLYRNTVFEMAEQLRQENRHRESLRHLFQVAYLDFNGPCNSLKTFITTIFRKNPAFDPGHAMLAPAVTALIKHLINQLKIDEDEAHEIYNEICTRIHKNLHLPLSPDKCWVDLEKIIFQ